ncbi:hypothetical protein QP027_07390 [Corynebacterium breve]|uniref:Secreted protein n=1 Tax=Corynebacterium breve TaxID=3049799 RepID=A0ABY8VCA6_9CORY|nr:hypothetical protein [Corynebacterium breve]WIM66957.1 hypothetical protein QP027_07390 [Corynebacterium breve]
MSSFDRARVSFAVGAVAFFIGLIVLLGMRTPPPPLINGDQLGQDPGESFSAYEQRAEDSLAALRGEENSFALVTFAQPLGPDDAAEVLEPVGRVNAMTVASAPARSLPEPTSGETRADVFTRELDRIAASLSGIGNVPTPDTFNGVVVWDVPDVLRMLDDDPAVATVEALPPDAAWGLFGVSPVVVD